MKLFFLLISIFFLHSCKKESSLHSKYPEAVVSDDYGILTESDVSQVKEIGEFNTEPSSLPRWICFESKNFKAKCINADYNDSLKFITGDLDLNVNENGKELHLDFNAVIANSACEEHLSSWKKLLSDEKYFCLSATLLAIDKSDPRKISGLFHQLKTKKGCDSWFVNDCK